MGPGGMGGPVAPPPVFGPETGFGPDLGTGPSGPGYTMPASTKITIRLTNVPLTEAMEVAQEPDVDLIALDGALEKLAALDPRKSHVIELRFFVGLPAEETARILQTSLRTVERDWTLAKAWLYREMTRDDGS